MVIFTQEQINQFLTLLRDNNVEVHAITIYQDGELLLDKAYAPFETSALHPLYSVSKSFLSIAVGYLVDEGLVMLEAPWLTYCPEYADKAADPAFAKVTVRNLLTMSLGQDCETAVDGEDDWAENIVGKRLAYAPGTKFFYNSMCSQLLSVMVQNVSGRKIVDLLAEKLFAPLGIQRYYWEQDRHGHNTGGFGLHLCTSDLAKFGLCCLAGGRYGDLQVIPAEWLAEATRKQIDNASEYSLNRTENRQGYGYHFWMCTHGAYRCSGMHGQLCFIQPHNKLVIAMSCAATGSQAILDCLFRAMDYPVPAAPFHDYAIPTLRGKADSFEAQSLNGRYEALDNLAGITAMEWSQTDSSHLHILLNKGEKKYIFSAGFDEWTRQRNEFEGFSQFMMSNSSLTMRPSWQEPVLFGNYAWITDTTLQIQLRALDCTSGFYFTFEVDSKYLTLHYNVKALYSRLVAFDAAFRRRPQSTLSAL